MAAALRPHTRVKLEDEITAARTQNHQLREDEAAAVRLLQQRQDELQRTSRCHAHSTVARAAECQWCDNLLLPRRLDEAEDRLHAAAAAAAASEACHARQENSLAKFESDAAEARARVQELEATCQQQAASLQARMQSQGQMEETIRQLQQVLPLTCCHASLHSAARKLIAPSRACVTAKRAHRLPIARRVSPLQACCWKLTTEKSWRLP